MALGAGRGFLSPLSSHPVPTPTALRHRASCRQQLIHFTSSGLFLQSTRAQSIYGMSEFEGHCCISLQTHLKTLSEVSSHTTPGHAPLRLSALVPYLGKGAWRMLPLSTDNSQPAQQMPRREGSAGQAYSRLGLSLKKQVLLQKGPLNF